MLPCERDRFSLPPGLHYLNAGYMGPLSKAVEAAGREGMRRAANPATIGAETFFERPDGVRERFGRLVGAPPERIALIPSASYGIATVAQNLPVRRGQRVVTLEAQFPSNVYAWRRLREAGAEVVAVAAPDGPQRARRWNERVLDAVTPETAVVALPHVHWTDGTRFDLAEIGRRAREVGAALVVDGTQSIGALPFSVAEVRPDALVVAAYKWLMGPYTTGCAYYGPRFDGGVPLEENWIARAGAEDFAGLTRYTDAYAPGAVRYDVGERSSPLLLPMLTAALDEVLRRTPEGVQAYCAALFEDALPEIQSLGFAIEDAAGRGAHLFGLRLPAGVALDALRAALEAERVSVSVRGDAVRVSPYVYNDASDVAALVRALRAAVARPAAA